MPGTARAADSVERSMYIARIVWDIGLVGHHIQMLQSHQGLTQILHRRQNGHGNGTTPKSVDVVPNRNRNHGPGAKVHEHVPQKDREKGR